jgi:hypothetical protein
MSEPENFLSRWSRKKLDGVQESAEAPAPELAREAAKEPAQKPAEPGAPPAAAGVPGKESPQPPVFDPASLPSLDSIDAQTDVTGFLKAGVPPDLTRAALRRAWSADPAIRDFKGLAENDWDFNDPNSMMGFGPLGPEVDVKRMLASLFGETPKEDPGATPAEPAPAIADAKTGNETVALNSLGNSSDDAAAAPAEPAAIDAEADRGGDAAAQGDEIVQRNSDIALQNPDTESPPETDRRKRSHGGALPQ